jgi:hypothetical protein
MLEHVATISSEIMVGIHCYKDVTEAIVRGLIYGNISTMRGLSKTTTNFSHDNR